jgi:ABC-type lipoprotein release transport system permease subunit
MLTVRQALSAVLFGVQPHDPLSSLAAGGLLFGAALVAGLPPAWRAMRVDPVDGLRTE